MSRTAGGFIDAKTLLSLVDRMYDELMIYDKDYRLVYANQACARHYGYAPEEMVGKYFFDFFNAKLWSPSLLPVVYERKKIMGINQKTSIGRVLQTIGAPILDENGDIEYVVCNDRDIANDIEFYQPQYAFEERTADTKFSLVVESDAMKQVINLVKKIKNVDATCILLGESGTGKSVVAKYLHSIGSRKDHPFIALNCANIPGELLEAELFGYVRGAFTGASASGKKGIFDAANRGIIFLDEVAELTMAAQAKLLHVLQENEFFPLGSSKPVATDVRIIAATNRDLKEMARIGQFREDLYYRLNVIDVFIPPLRNRKKDIIPLIHHFMHYFCVKYDITRQFTEEALNVLADYEWPGNVRELQHNIERLVITVDGPVIDVADLSGMVAHPEGGDSLEACPAADSSLEKQMEKHEAFLVREAWQKCRSSRKMANYFSISQSKANNLIRKYIPKE
jgi:PAS domain S-box-containing protein